MCFVVRLICGFGAVVRLMQQPQVCVLQISVLSSISGGQGVYPKVGTSGFFSFRARLSTSGEEIPHYSRRRVALSVYFICQMVHSGLSEASCLMYDEES